MQTTPRTLLRLSTLAAACAASLIGTGAVAQTSGAGSNDIQSQYQAERAACMNGTSQQDRATCLREADAALGEARKGNLTTSNQYRENAIERCRALPQRDREACVGRISNPSNVSGSVEGGGVLRSYTQRIVGQPQPAPAPQPMPQSQPMPSSGMTTTTTPVTPVAPPRGYAPATPGAPVYVTPPTRVDPSPDYSAPTTSQGGTTPNTMPAPGVRPIAPNPAVR